MLAGVLARRLTSAALNSCPRIIEGSTDNDIHLSTSKMCSPSLPVPMSWSSIALICAWADMVLTVRLTLTESLLTHAAVAAACRPSPPPRPLPAAPLLTTFPRKQRQSRARALGGCVCRQPQFSVKRGCKKSVTLCRCWRLRVG